MTTSPASASVPLVVGMRAADAMQALLSLGYNVKTVKQASTAVPPGTVVSMSPPAGTRLALGSTIEVTISTGFERSA
jgi:eukaryotic-like serine/threonine-protein kinase